MSATAQQLSDLLEWLRDHPTSRFEVGDAQFLAAYDLIETIAARGEWPAETDRWRTLLAPVLCDSAGEQDRFYELFRERFGAAIVREERETTPITAAVLGRVRKVRRWWLHASATALVILLAAGAYGWSRLRVPPRLSDIGRTLKPPAPPEWWNPREVPRAAPKDMPNTVRVQVASGNDRRPLSGATVYYAGQVGQTGASGLVEFPASDPDRWVLATHPRFKPAAGQVRSAQYFALTPRPSGLKVSGWRAWYADHVVPVSFGAGMLPLCAFAFWLALQIRREAELKRLTAPLEAKMRQLGLRAGVPLFGGPDMRKLAVSLRKRRAEESDEIDPAPTVEETARAGGRFSPVRAKRSAEPDYLVLGERKNARDHLSRLLDELLARLRDHDVAITRYYFQSHPAVCSDARSQVFTLPELAAIHPNHELWLVCDPETLTDPVTGEPEPWAPVLNHWRTRVLMSTEHRDRAARQAAALEMEMRVADPSRRGIQELASDSAVAKPERADQDAPFPSLIEEHEDLWLDRAAPPAAAVSRMTAQLRRYLGPDGFLCLQACAVYPEVAWSLTLTLASELTRERAEEVLNRLSALPWFRHGMMPEWFRIRLLSGLKEDEERVRAAVLRYLETASEKIRRKEVLELLPRRPESEKLDRLRPVQDRVYLAFMQRKKVDEAAVKAPKGWRKFLYESLAVRGTVLGVAAYLAAAGLWIGGTELYGAAVRSSTVREEAAPRPANAFVARLMDFAEVGRDLAPWDQAIWDLDAPADVVDRKFPALVPDGANPGIRITMRPRPGQIRPLHTRANPTSAASVPYYFPYLNSSGSMGVVERVMPNGDALLFDGTKSTGPFLDLTGVELGSRVPVRDVSRDSGRPPGWDKSAPRNAWCYQEEKPAWKFGVHCHWSEQRCNQAKRFTGTATACALVSGLDKTAWRPGYAGYMESWYQLGLASPLPAPFPELAPAAGGGSTSTTSSASPNPFGGAQNPYRETFAATGDPIRDVDIVWVDDNLEGIRSEINQLRAAGYAVTWVANTAEALKGFGTYVHAGVISDIGRKEGGRDLPTAGFDTLAQVRKAIPGIPFYFYTTTDNARQYRDQALKAGANGITADRSELLGWFTKEQPSSAAAFKYDPSARVRPLRPGYRIAALSTGTLGAIVRDSQGSISFLGARQTLGQFARVGQPNQPDLTGVPPSVAAMNQSVALTKSSGPFGAIAEVVGGLSVDPSLPDGTAIQGVLDEVTQGMRVKLYGGTSGYQEGSVTRLSRLVNPPSSVIIVHAAVSAYDAGAPVLTLDNRLIGMLFAVSGGDKLVIPISTLLKEFGATLLGPGVVIVPQPNASPQQQKAR